MNPKELLRRYAAGELNFTGVDLSEAQLIDVDLRNIILKDADLSFAVMDLSRLMFADFMVLIWK